jgi:hypothetical protein
MDNCDDCYQLVRAGYTGELCSWHMLQVVTAQRDRMREALRVVLDSDMAQREEDEGEQSETLALVREALGEPDDE